MKFIFDIIGNLFMVALMLIALIGLGNLIIQIYSHDLAFLLLFVVPSSVIALKVHNDMVFEEEL